MFGVGLLMAFHGPMTRCNSHVASRCTGSY